MRMQTSILLVEDDVNLSTVLADYLRSKGYTVEQAGHGAEAWDLMLVKHYDLVISDIMMPKMNGYELLKLVRQKYERLPIIILSAKTDRDDIIHAYELGCDDYVTKPFSPSELMARIDAVYRRVSLTVESDIEKNSDNIIAIGEFVLDLRSHTLTKNGENIDLTQMEFQIIEYFFTNPNVALDRSDILKFVWGDSYFGDEKVVDVNIHRLRNKVEEEPSQPKHLTTVWGMGYKWIV